MPPPQARLDRHLGQFVDAVAVMSQRHRPDRAHSVPLAVEREQDSPPVGEDVPLGVAQHFLVERLDHEPAAQPFQVQARESSRQRGSNPTMRKALELADGVAIRPF